MSEEAQRLEGELTEPIETEPSATATHSETKGLVDSTGRRIHAYPSARIIGGDYEAKPGVLTPAYAPLAQEVEEVMVLSLRRTEFERLNVKIDEVLAEAALAQERIAKDQQEIEQL